jgi:hypothetical protein
MTKKLKTTTDTVLNKAEVLLKDLEAAARGTRLRKSEAEVKDSAKPKSRGGRLIEAEADVAARQRPDPRLLYSEMKPERRREPTKPNAKAELIRAYRRAADAVRR